MSYAFAFSARTKTEARAKMLDIEAKDEYVPAPIAQLVIDSISKLELQGAGVIVVEAHGHGSAAFNRTDTTNRCENHMTVKAI